MTMRVVLVDDHEPIRHGLRRAFERTGDFEVVAEAGTVRAGVAAVRSTAPDVVVLDVRLPDGSGFDACREVRAASSTLGIVMLTMDVGDEPLSSALEAGASAFVHNDAPADEVVAAARHAVASPLVFSAADLAPAMRRRLEPSGRQLSAREKDVLGLLADGLGVSAIAGRLFISESTTKTHISKLYEKLGAANRAQALMTALRLGLINPERGKG